MAAALHRADAAQLAREGVERVDVICPGFAADCLETLEEIARRRAQAFLAAGGKSFHYIACLNDQHEWIARAGATSRCATCRAGTRRPDPMQAALQAQRERALALRRDR